MTEFLENRLQGIALALERIDRHMGRIADALERAYPETPKSMKLDGQVAHEGTPDTKASDDYANITEELLKKRVDMMMRLCRPIAKDAAQKALQEAAAAFPGKKVVDWPAKARADLYRKLRNIDPLDDEIPF